MLNFFKSKKDKESVQSAPNTMPDISGMSDAKQQLFMQLKAKRAELGPEEIAKMQNAVKMQALQNKIKNDIDNDDDKRARLLDEIRFHLSDK